VFGQDRELPQNLRQFTNSRFIECELDFGLADPFRPNHVPVIGGEQRMQPLEGLEGKDDVVGRHGFAVVPLRRRV
jgi:hypothetical protein